MKYISTCFFLIFLCSSLFTQTSRDKNLIQYIPKDVSFVLYLNSLDKSFKEFKSSSFWKYYKRTKEGKELEKSLNSFDASLQITSFITLDDLLEVFSQQAFIGIWLGNNNIIKNYIYLIEKKKNKNKIKSILERLEYFAVANKINIKKYEQNSFKIINFTNQICLAENKEFVLISNNLEVLENICSRINNRIVNKHNLIDFKKYFKNNNLVFYLKTPPGFMSQKGELYYSFRFKGKPELEILYKDKKITNTRQFKFNNDYFKVLPPDINFIQFGNENVRDSIYPFFDLIGTNFYKIDKKYFDTYFSEPDTKGINPQLIAGKLTSKTTNLLRIIDVSLQSNYMDKFPDNSPTTTYLNYNIYNNSQVYYAFIKKNLIISRQESFLKKAINTYKKNRGFYFTKDFKKIQAYKNKNTIVWMNLRKYLTDKALKYGKDKWAHYNAYIKTYDKLMIYSGKKIDCIYMKLFFY